MTINIQYLQSGKQFLTNIIKEHKSTKDHKIKYLCLSQSFKECLELTKKLNK